MPPRVRIAGRGRAGGSLAAALGGLGWDVELVPHNEARAEGADVLVLAVPDDAVAATAARVVPGQAVVAHMAGALGLDVLAPHRRRAALHPLVALPNAELGATRLRGAWFAVAGDEVAEELVAALGGRAFTVADAGRARYHAAACVASNHLVALLAQVQRLAASEAVPFEAYLDLVRATVDNVAELGPEAAITGPAARGDVATIERHLAALSNEERTLYAVVADACRRLGGRP